MADRAAQAEARALRQPPRLPRRRLRVRAPLVAQAADAGRAPVSARAVAAGHRRAVRHPSSTRGSGSGDRRLSRPRRSADRSPGKRRAAERPFLRSSFVAEIPRQGAWDAQIRSSCKSTDSVPPLGLCTPRGPRARGRSFFSGGPEGCQTQIPRCTRALTPFTTGRSRRPAPRDAALSRTPRAPPKPRGRADRRRRSKAESRSHRCPPLAQDIPTRAGTREGRREGSADRSSAASQWAPVKSGDPRTRPHRRTTESNAPFDHGPDSSPTRNRHGTRRANPAGLYGLDGGPQTTFEGASGPRPEARRSP